jgi:5-methylcytosine-specific restriction endonuclease McrA
VALSKAALGSGRWKEVRLRVLARDGYTCAYCGQEADQVDHVQSRVSGGSLFDQDNLVAACRRCNQLKGAKGANTLFFRSGSTPPAFPDRSLPATVATKPESPFQKP